MKLVAGNTLAIQLQGIVMTGGAHMELREAFPDIDDFHAAMRGIIDRHINGDWGDVDEHDAKVNNRAVKTGARIVSEYTVEGVRLWVISDAAWTENRTVREVTTILRPEDY